MGDAYAATGVQAVVTASPGDTALSVEGVALTRGRLYDAIVGHGGTPADNVIAWLVRRGTLTGTDTAVTPQQLDGDGPAAQITAGEDHSAEPTFAAGSELLDFPLNQRATFRWVVAPNGEIVVAAAVTDIIGFTPISAAYASTAEATAMWRE